MTEVQSLKRKAVAIADGLKEELFSINRYLYENPEIGKEEYKACEKLVKILQKNGFVVEKGICGYETAFKAVYQNDKSEATVAYLCEYDALPQIGHGCGHNMIATMSAGAGLVLSKLFPEIGGKIIVFGTPAEETCGAKVVMAENGVFEGIDAAMMIHPESFTHASGVSLAMDALEFSFKGRSCHAASAPEKGINALDAVVLTFQGINALRQHITRDARIHGIINNGGIAPNVVPDFASARFYVRAQRRAYLDELTEKVKNCARGAALMTGAELTIENYELSYDDMLTNEVLSENFNKNLVMAGEPVVLPPRDSYGSIDMGNVSNCAPSIHPYLSVVDLPVTGHTKAMAEATVTKRAEEAIVRGVLALTFTGIDILLDSELRERVAREFKQKKV